MAGRRGNNEGSIVKRADGRWMARVSVEGGKRKTYYAKTRAEVVRLLTQARHDLGNGLPLLDGRQTVQQYLETWSETLKLQLRGSSLRRYGDYVRVHLIPGLGKVPLVKLSAQQVQLFYARKLGEGLSATTVHHMHGVLHRALKDALRMGLVQRNVTEMVRAPRRAATEMVTLSEEQVRRFLDAVTGDRFEALYVLAVTTGMREGELLGLRWQDIDLERVAVQVRMNVQETEGPYILAETKTAYSRRSIALTQVAVTALRSHRDAQTEERRLMGRAWDASLDLVFPNSCGGIMNPDNLAKRAFKRQLVKAGLPNIRFHDLRHTAATLLLSRGVNVKVVSEMLGHADVSITLRVYAHVLPHMQQAAVEVMEGVVRGKETL